MTTPDELLRLAERVEQGSGENTPLRMHISRRLHINIGQAFTSLDAVEALRLRLLPESFADSEQTTHRWWATVQLEYGAMDEDTWSASAPTEARARLAALLRAVAGKEA